MKMRKKIRRGFTLVELVVVIAVIAILAGVSVGAYFGITDSANSSAATQYQKQIKDLWIMYSVSTDYVDDGTDDGIRQNAEYFCLTYVKDNGPANVIVNYRLIDINPSFDLTSNITSLSSPIARPPCGGVPYLRASLNHPNLLSICSSVSSKALNISS